LLGAVVTLAALYGLRGHPVGTPVVHAQGDSAAAVEQAFVAVAERTLPAVVNISAERVEQVPGIPPEFRDFFKRFPFPFDFKLGPDEEEEGGENPKAEQRAQSLGSGWIYSPDGYIVTNWHVVRGAKEIKVTLHDRKDDDRKYPAKLVGHDPRSELAVLKINVDRKLPTLVLGDSDAVKVGQWAMAFGAPFSLEQTVTVGIISAKGRFLEDLPGLSKYIRIGDVLQTDAAINPGNSGGPLVNLRGEVIGINVAIVSPGAAMVPGNVGIGFAIPSNTAKQVVPQLIQTGRVARGWLGIMIRDLNANLREYYGAPQGGALVTGIKPDGPAAKSDLKEDDVIVSVDGKPVRDTWELQKSIADTPPGKTVTLGVIRDKKPIEVKVKVGEMPAKYAGLEGETEEKGTRQAALLGIEVGEITEANRKALGLPDVPGVVVLKIDPESPAYGMLQRGDVITEIDHTRITDLDDYNKALTKAKQEKAKFLVIHFVRKEEGEVVRGVVDITPNW
ncbi:MAG: Do family serine endopeptidase, partial [Armatimonadetes bacterium]|nr:Do family serine endopeptidase [Armatimonadota bacterium]